MLRMGININRNLKKKANHVNASVSSQLEEYLLVLTLLINNVKTCQLVKLV